VRYDAQTGGAPPPPCRIVSLLLVLVVPALAAAHALDPALLDVRERPGGTAEVLFRTSSTRVTGAQVDPVLPEACRVVRPPLAAEEGAAVSVRWAVDCGPDGWVGRQVGVDGLARAGTDALVRIALADGRLVQRVLRAAEPRLVVPARPSAATVIADYGRLGVVHILGGLDHLLFVLGLVLLVGPGRRLVGTVTAFTLGHSVTLTLAVLRLANVPARPTEVLIAASVLLLAIELARPVAAPGLLGREPWVMALCFGLLHGLGFAGALREIGLPAGDVPLALASFNAGVEAGQIAFVALVLGVGWLGTRLAGPPPRWGRLIPVYTMGALAAFWCFERIAALIE
jgi:hydrogenase/urease accessory protein HupE